MTDTMQELSSWLRAAPQPQDLDYALRKAAAIREWCLDGFPVKEGDLVRIARRLNTDNGWKPYAEALAVGAVATVHAIDFNTFRRGWYADIMLDREWSVGDVGNEVRRWWNGRTEDTPEGMTPPSKYDQENYPDGRRHLFSLPIAYLEPIAVTADA